MYGFLLERGGTDFFFNTNLTILRYLQYYSFNMLTYIGSKGKGQKVKVAILINLQPKTSNPKPFKVVIAIGLTSFHPEQRS